MYRLTTANDIVRESDGAAIPRDEGNGDYRDYLAWVEAGNTPTSPIERDWRPQAQTDLNAFRARLLGVLTSMLGIYQAKEEPVNAAAVVAAMEAVTTIQDAESVKAAYDAMPGSRVAYDAAVKARWLQIVAPAPPQVKADWFKYGGSTV